ncbi:MAG: GIY-YIG nuclease family protein [Patescibacteria group bacterium]|jgi:group I intron endonuclease
MRKRFNVIYKIKNEQRKCFYIGYSTLGLNHRKHTHKYDCFKRKLNTKLYNFIRKYGWDSFNWKIIAVYSTPEELQQAEINWIKQQKEEFSDWECLNSVEGGSGNLGWVPSIDTRNRMSESRKKYLKENPDILIKQIKKMKENYSPQNHSIKMKELYLKNPNRTRGENNSMYGKHHSKEEKKRRSKMMAGNNNPMYKKSFYSVWLEKYGKEIANEKLKKWADKHRKTQHPVI